MRITYRREKETRIGLCPSCTEWQYMNNLMGNYIVSPRERLDSERRKHRR